MKLNKKSFVEFWTKIKNFKFTRTKKIYVCKYLPTIICFTNIDGTSSDIYNDRLFGTSAKERALYQITSKLARENNPKLFEAFEILRKHNLDVTFFIDTQIFKNQ